MCAQDMLVSWMGFAEPEWVEMKNLDRCREKVEEFMNGLMRPMDFELKSTRLEYANIP